ncbi:MAG: hypothetical protein KF785_14205 [Gemmatimonadales bacterium]|nr:hypothetical protein [Gemmatimonadales bacterium]
MLYRRTGLAAALLLGLAACSDRPTVHPTQPNAEQAVVPRTDPPELTRLRERHEWLAEQVAIAMRDPGFRRTVLQELRGSPLPEGKISLQHFLSRAPGARAHLAGPQASNELGLTERIADGPAIEVYFPVPEHRARWSGGEDLLVATAELDTDAPVAFDLAGRRHRLSPTTPPETPVLMIGRAELDFDRPLANSCLIACDDLIGGGGGGGGGDGSAGGSAGSQGLFMTRSKFVGTFEGWFKGAPEFEVHVLGKAGSENALTSYQCAGEHAGGPYAFDQNSTEWSGSVMLMSQAQLDNYRIQHPGQALRVFVVEDDDGACQIKIDQNRANALFESIRLVYGDNTGGKDATGPGGKIFQRAPIYIRILKALYSFFATNDDPVGNAVEDANAANAYLSGANWVVRGENSVMNGAIKLEMR